MNGTGGSVAIATPDIGGIRKQVRARRRAVSVPLLVTGSAITAVTARQLVYQIVTSDTHPWEAADAGPLDLWPVRLAFWLLVPASFLGLWWTRRRLRSGRGLGVTLPSAVATGVVTTFVLLTPFFLVLFVLGPFLAFCLGLFIIGVAERTRAVWAWALGVGIPGVLESFRISNLLPLSIDGVYLYAGIMLALAAVTVVAGAVAWWHENRVLAAA